MVLKWVSIDDRTYSIWKATNLTEGFWLEASSLPCTPPENEYQDNAPTASRASFYRVEVEE